MKERPRWGLRGPVRMCQLQRTWSTSRCSADGCETEKRSDSKTLMFRENGSLAERSHRNPDGSEWIAVYLYDMDRLAAVRTENGTSVVSLSLYQYDEVGRLFRVITRHADGADRVSETYEYDPDGRKSKIIHVDVPNQRPDTQQAWAVEGTDTSYFAVGTTKIRTIYSEREQPTHLLFYDAMDHLLSRVEFSYDANGNLIQEAQTKTVKAVPPEMIAAMNPAQLETVSALFGAGSQPLLRVHRYDENGRRIETRSQIGPLGANVKTMVYNEYGDQIAEIVQNEARDYGIDDKGQLTEAPTKVSMNRSEARFRYDYDANRNWVLKTVEVRTTEDQHFTESSVERRTIEYFG